MQMISIIVLQMIITLIYFCPTINCLTILQAIQYRGYRGDGGLASYSSGTRYIANKFLFYNWGAIYVKAIVYGLLRRIVRCR